MPSLVDKAVGFAAQAHDGQRRKIGSIPYIADPVGVAIILQQMGCSETVVAAGLLHDVVEDTKYNLEDIRQRFGEEVAEIVAGCTEPPKKQNKWESRKLHTINSIRTAALPVKLVAAADKYHNLSHTLHNEQKNGPGVWKRFGRGKGQQAWYYRAVSDSITANVQNIERYPIFKQLEAMVEEIFSGTVSIPPD